MNRSTERRADALSKARIVEAAIEMLDADGESGLTFRALATQLATGSGAIYWHVRDKDTLLAAVAEDVLARALGNLGAGEGPRKAIRAVSLAVFDAVEAHPWIGAQLAREPSQPAMLMIFEKVGAQVQALGVPERVLFAHASVIMNYILGVAGQNAAYARAIPKDTDRTAFLTLVADQWTRLDPATHPFIRSMAQAFPEHDDREQFVFGVDLILLGIDATPST